MDTTAEVLFVLWAYVLGSLPVLYWIGKARGFELSRDEDLHQALWRDVGYAEGFAGVSWDVIKGPVPPLLAWALDFSSVTIGLSGLAVTAGQMWPLFTRFYGKERGNTTGLGSVLAIAPLTLAFALIPLAIGGAMRITSSWRKANGVAGERLKFAGMSDAMPLGMLGSFIALAPVAWLLDEDAATVGTLGAMFAMIIIRRLTADLSRDLAANPPPNLTSVLKNRFLYDRSYY